MVDVTPVDYSSGVRRMMPVVLMGWLVLTFIFLSLKFAFRDSFDVFGLSPSPEFCHGNMEGCNRTDLFAFQCASGVALTLCALIGFNAWHVSKRVHKKLPSTAEGRLVGYLPEAELLAAINFTFQSWDFLVSLFIPEHATWIMLSHHVMASTVAWCSIRYQYLHYYSIFFLGLTEVSSIFLVFLDLSKYYPPRTGGIFDIVVTICGPSFVFTFIYYRVILWWPESFRLLKDVVEVIRSGRAEKLRPGASWVLFVFLSLNFPLGLLQLYWVSIIAEEVNKSLQPPDIGLTQITL